MLKQTRKYFVYISFPFETQVKFNVVCYYLRFLLILINKNNHLLPRHLLYAESFEHISVMLVQLSFGVTFISILQINWSSQKLNNFPQGNTESKLREAYLFYASYLYFFFHILFKKVYCRFFEDRRLFSPSFSHSAVSCTQRYPINI